MPTPFFSEQRRRRAARIRPGDWVRVPAGTLVRNLTRGTEDERRTSYRCRVIERARLGDGIVAASVLWQGDRADVFTCREADVSRVDPPESTNRRQP